MPVFTIETTFHLPVYRHRSITANTIEEACRVAMADEDWWDQKHDYDNSGATYVSGAWLGDDAAYRGAAMPVPSAFGERVQRQAEQFRVLHDILKRCAAVDDTAARAAIARGEAILAGADDPH